MAFLTGNRTGNRCSLYWARLKFLEKEDMNENNTYDLTRISYEGFVSFLFDHEVNPLPEEQLINEHSPWYFHADVTYDPAAISKYYMKLFGNPDFLFQIYTREQLEQGLWAIMTMNLDCSIANIIWNTDLDFENRANCVRAIYDLYNKLFSKDSLDTSCYMFWDSLAYDWHCGNRKRENGGEDLLMQDVMFETLINILKLASVDCQYAALHGLGHLHHPGTSTAIMDYLQRDGEMNDELKSYAGNAIKFNVM
jgi:hypothetical protein